VEFLRGKYNIENRNYILKLFSNMTEKEKYNISSCSFDVLWKQLWQINNTQPFQKEYSEAKKKFTLLCKGYIIKCPSSNTTYTCNIKTILSSCKTSLSENEWGFPKGRRNINEKDILCAIREFVEEAGIESKNININFDQKPYEEIFNGSNKIRYRHIYYIANMPIINNTDLKPRKSTNQSLEIKDVKWFKYNEAQSKIFIQNIERKELLKRINHAIVKNIINP
jgi:8-oxo-dGTP pyrophosphatase MutT (NUDIX family)